MYALECTATTLRLARLRQECTHDSPISANVQHFRAGYPAHDNWVARTLLMIQRRVRSMASTPRSWLPPIDSVGSKGPTHRFAGVSHRSLPHGARIGEA